MLILGTHCPHCPAVLQALSTMIKAGELGRLDVINLEQMPDIAQSLGVRSVPWVCVGPFELQGVRTLDELRGWALKAGTVEGMADYIAELIGEGKIERVTELVHKDSFVLDAVLHLLGDSDVKMNIRLGLGVVIEALQNTALLRQRVDELGTLSSHESAAIRADASHYLALTGAEGARSYLQARLEDADKDVREIAEEGLEMLGDGS
jgi:hypothetical protein